MNHFIMLSALEEILILRWTYINHVDVNNITLLPILLWLLLTFFHDTSNKLFHALLASVHNHLRLHRTWKQNTGLDGPLV